METEIVIPEIVNGVEVEVDAQLLGQGYASVAYLGSNGSVYVFNDSQQDGSKLLFNEVKSPHIPPVELMGKLADGIVVLKMPYYEPIEEYSVEGQLLLDLYDQWNNFASQNNLWKRENASLTPELTQDFIEDCDAPQSIKDALRALCAVVHAEYPHYQPDFSLENAGIDKSGTIVLFDALCDPF